VPPDLLLRNAPRILFAKNHYQGVTVWQRVGRAIEELERQKPREGEALN